MAVSLDEKIQRDKEAVDKMRGAQAAMRSALDRIDALERALVCAKSELSVAKGYVGPSVYIYTDGGNKKSVQDQIDGWIDGIETALQRSRD